MKITRLVVNPFAESTYMLWHEDGGDAFIVDPGMIDDYERDQFARFIDSHKLNVTKVLLTHVHVDHVLAVSWMVEKYGASVEYSKDDDFMRELIPEQIRSFGLRCEFKQFDATRFLVDGEVLDLNGEKIDVIAIPGHSRGSLSFHSSESKKVIAGDAVFAMSIGRTDLAGGNYEQLINSINTKLMTLPEDTVIYPGHGDCTTVGEEKRYNPFLK